MSRGFVRESDQEELPPIPPRAPLPPGVPNYVTPRGRDLLVAERRDLEAQMAAVPTNDEDERRRSLTVLNARLAQLQQRINVTRLVKPGGQNAEEIRFGATINLKMGEEEKTYQIVGVDEADPARGKLAFTAPLAKQLVGLSVGDEIDFWMDGADRRVAVLGITYI